MKKIIYISVFFITFLSSIDLIYASNKIYEIDITAKINSDASADITEIWSAYVDNGTEFYKPMSNLNGSEISNFKVSDNSGTTYKNISWNIDATFQEKAYKNGINETTDGLELCWGMSSYGDNTYEISYHITNFVRNLEDSQIIYFQFVNDSMDPSPLKVKVTVESDELFSDDLEIETYGYEGIKYIEDGKIYMETDNELDSSEYMVLLARFDLNTFNASITEEGSFDDWSEKANEGTFSYDNESSNFLEIILILLMFLIFPIFFIILIIIFIIYEIKFSSPISGVSYGEHGKVINYKSINYYRDIPCDKDIYMAYFIATLYKINKRREDFLGTILLKWLNEGSIEVKETGKTMFKNKTIYSIDLKINEKKYYQNNRELELFEMLKVASKDGILESNEFERWCSNNYTKVLKWFDNILKDEKLELTNKGYLILTEKKFLKIFTHKTYEVNYILKDKAIELAGLKKFLIDFSDIKNKEVIEVHLWKEYLMFAQIFGIANKVAKQFAKLYPNVITDINYDGIITVNSIARIGTMAAISSSASSSSGISSSLGGGGGAFGGSSGGGTR